MANTSLAHATQSHRNGNYNHKSIFLIKPRQRIQYAAELMEELFGKAHCKTSIHFADACVRIRVAVGSGGATDKVNARLATDLILRNALNCRGIEVQRHTSSGKSKISAPSLVLTASTSLDRIAGAERAFRRREQSKWALDVAVVTAVCCAVWELMLWAWGSWT